MNTDFDILINRRGSDSVKWNHYEEEVLPLWVADMDFMSPEPVIDALRERLDHGLFGYSRPLDSAKSAICDWLMRRHNWAVSPDDVLLFPGVVPAFNIAARACTNPGDSVLIQTPAYHPFLELSRNQGLVESNHVLRPGGAGRYEIDLVDFIDHILPSTRIFMLCNPHNPTGRVFRKDELTALAEACLERNVIICSDEIHSDLIYPPNRHVPIASISAEISQATITLISPSKSFNLAGLKSSAVIITNKRLRKAFLDQTRGIAGSVNILGSVALIAAYRRCDDWLEELLIYLDKNRRFLYQYVESELPGVSMALPEGTFLGWLDFSNTVLESPGSYLLEQARVGLNPGEWFGDDFAKFARINFGCPLVTLNTALERIKSALSSP